ncbi:MAG TPA: C40 family peptidase [Spirochaetota bacterium]|nr:C40 family peptidase [Spirochaetota bacterium]
MQIRSHGMLPMLLLLCLTGCMTTVSRAQGTNTPTGAVQPAGKRGDVVTIARRYLGTPYRYGGSDPRGFDCSGFVLYVFGQVGVRLPHTAAGQFGQLQKIQTPQPGDLVFFHTYGAGVSHVGIYAGNNQFIHSPRAGKTVEYTDMRIEYWRTRYRGARRAL